jgi:hypothetical protein
MRQLLSRVRFVTGFIVLVVVLTLAAWQASHTTISAAPPGPPTTSVLVTNSGASQAIPSNINAGGTPNVNIANTPLTVTTGPARHRFQYRFLTCFMSPGEGGCNVTFDVPAGKLLVIETVSVGETLAPGQKPFALMQAYTDGLFNPFFLPQTYIFTDGIPTDHYGSIHTPRIYADPGTTITVFFQRDQTTGGGAGGGTISGYFIDCASPATCALP